jgi:hypothetical protein
MSASFGKRLKREFTANPKKAAALCLLLLVAIWFWAPLLQAWFLPDANAPVVSAGATTGSPGSPTMPNPGASPGNPAATAPMATAGSAPLPGTAGAESAKPFADGCTWQQIAAAIDADERMKPAVSLASRTNVFPAAPSPEEARMAATEEPVTEPPPAKLSPSEAGLVLSSTIVGRNRRTALINGRRYAVGDEIKSAKEGQQIVFKLLAVEPRQIVLENAGDRFLVKMPGGRLSTDDNLQ